MPSKHTQLKNLFHLYWEARPKYDENGRLKQEIILVVNAIRNDLQHSNEYFPSKDHERLIELLESPIPVLRANP